MTLQDLYELGNPISAELAQLNKYTFSGANNILDVRLITINDIIGKTTQISTYVATHYSVLMFPNIVNGIIVDAFFKPLDGDGRPLKLGSKYFPFGLQYLSRDFKYGDQIILVEGVGDLAGLRFIDDKLNVIAMQTSVISYDHMDFVAALTNNVILLTDNDKTGDESRGKIINRFKKLGVSCVALNQYATLKDTGQIIELALGYLKTMDSRVKLVLEDIMRYYSTIISLQNY